MSNDPRRVKDYHLFFHKHKFYEFEKEFRAVIFGELAAVDLELPDGILTGITLPPSRIPPLRSSVVEDLKARFGELVQPSTLCWLSNPRKDPSLDDYLLDKTMPKTDEILQLAEKRKHLQQQMTGWNDPKAPPINNISVLMRQLEEVEEQLVQEMRDAGSQPLACLDLRFIGQSANPSTETE